MSVCSSVCLALAPKLKTKGTKKPKSVGICPKTGVSKEPLLGQKCQRSGVKGSIALSGNPFQKYRASPAIWDHMITCHPTLTPAR